MQGLSSLICNVIGRGAVQTKPYFSTMSIAEEN